MNLKDREFKFMTEHGVRTLTYAQYLEDQELMATVADATRIRGFMGTTVMSFDPGKCSPQMRARVDLVNVAVKECAMQYFLPSGESALRFLNDTDHDVKGLLAGNRRGKTAHCVIDVLMDCFPCDKNWAIFKQHGVKWRPWKGPQKVGWATSDWNVMSRVLWPEIKKWIPQSELQGKEPSLPNKPQIKLACGTEFFFFVYEQKQGPYEGQVLNLFYWDEQGEEPKFDGADERLRTVRGRHVFGLTPHKVEGRPDTGARSWIHKMITGQRTKGHNPAFYTIGPDDVPDWVYPEDEKRKAYEKWILEPQRENNTKAIREGRSRFYGEWHDAAGLVFDEWEDKVHVIEDFPVDPMWTRYRAIDFGSVNPTGCLCGAVDPEGNVYVYQEYYRSGLLISENAANIIQLCGNTRKSEGVVTVARSGIMMERFMEIMNRQRFLKTVLDSRSFEAKDPNTFINIGNLFRFYGIGVTPASGLHTERAVPIAKEFFRIDPKRKNPVTGEMGAPRLYIFASCANLIREIKNYAHQEFKSSRAALNSNVKERPISKDDHLIDCLLYLLQIPPRYIPDRWAFDGTEKLSKQDDDFDEDDVKSVMIVDSHTGY